MSGESPGYVRLGFRFAAFICLGLLLVCKVLVGSYCKRKSAVLRAHKARSCNLKLLLMLPRPAA